MIFLEKEAADPFIHSFVRTIATLFIVLLKQFQIALSVSFFYVWINTKSILSLQLKSSDFVEYVLATSTSSSWWYSWSGLLLFFCNSRYRTSIIKMQVFAGHLCSTYYAAQSTLTNGLRFQATVSYAPQQSSAIC
jgi:hypothetical protein